MTVTRVTNPIGAGHSYYADAGPEGQVLIWNSADLPVNELAALGAWELEPPSDGAPTLDHTRPKPDPTGWRY